jgi:hypothetical protein
MPCSRAKLNQRILRAAARFISETNLSCRQDTSPAMHEFVVGLIQIGPCIQPNDDAITAHAPAFIDQMTEKEMVDTIRATGKAKFAQAMEQL